MGRRKSIATSRQRVVNRLRKLRGLLKGKPSALEVLLKDRRGEVLRHRSRGTGH